MANGSSPRCEKQDRPRVRRAIAEKLIYVAEILYRYCPSIAPRPVLILDHENCLTNWFGISVSGVRQKMIVKGIVVFYYSIKSAVQNDDSAARDLNQKYKGIYLFETIEYSLYMSLGIPAHEFNPSKREHYKEALRWLSFARLVVDELLQLIRRLRPKAVVVIQGYFVEAAVARQLSGQYAFQVFALENTFHTARMICEPHSSISVNKNSSMLFFHRYQQRLMEQDNQGWMSEIISHIDASKQAEHASASRAYLWPPGCKRVLFLAQCLTDSSVLFGVSGQYSAVEIVQALIDYGVQNNSFIFIKLHPKEYKGSNPLHQPYRQVTMRKLKDKGIASSASERENMRGYFVDAENNFSTQQLMRDSDVVVTINSQGGLEAQAFDKEVVLLGEAFYDRLGTTWNISHLSILPAVLDAILKDGARLADREKVARFMRVYFETYCIKKSSGGLAAAIHQRLYRKPEEIKPAEITKA